MIVEPVRRGAVCATAHPEGCARQVRDAIERVRAGAGFTGPARVLVIGASAGLGLATRITAAYGAGAATVGVCLERPGAPNRTATAGWYNTAALESELAAAGRYGRTVLGDAFSDEVKERTAQLITSELGSVDLVVYSLAAPRRTDPDTGQVYRSVIKTVGEPYTEKAFDADASAVRPLTLHAATEQEAAQTERVMGGDDWRRWIDVLDKHGALAADATTVAFSYVGNDWLAPTYRAGTLGRAKEHLEATARELADRLAPGGGRATAAVMRALITQASQVMPVQALYTLLLSRVTREQGLYEDTLDQARRLLAGQLYGTAPMRLDEAGRVRLDDLELRADVQAEVRRRWKLVETGNLAELGDLDGYWAAASALHGFGVPGVDYTAEVDPVRAIPNSLLP